MRQDVGRRRQDRCHICIGTVASAEPLPLEILKSYAQVRTMLFANCSAQADLAAGDVVPMDLSMVGKGKGQRSKGKGKTSENSKDEKDKDEDKKGKGKARPCQSDQALSWILSCLLGLGACDEGLLVEGERQEREGHCISADADHASREY